MRICVFGAGSLGSALGGLLAARNDVVLIGRKQHMHAVRRCGLEIVGDVRRRVSLQAHEKIDGVPRPDLLLITTKAYDTETAVKTCRDWARGSTLVLTLQNGIGNLEILRQWKGSQAFGGTTTLGANLLRPGVVRLSGLGMTSIGADVDSKNAAIISDIMSSCGIPSRVKKDIRSEIWQKAIVSASINPITAVLRIPNGRLLGTATLLRLIDSVTLESLGIASSQGLKVSASRMVSRVRQVARDTAENRSSMLQDIQRGKRTEISMINGAICKVAECEGIPAPLNSVLFSMVEEMERQPPRGKG